ncbi:MAG: hypothetical protein ACRCX2_22535 [Paraclostridium sp.]
MNREEIIEKQANLIASGAKALGSFAAKSGAKRALTGAAVGAGVKGTGYALSPNNENKSIGGLAKSMASGATTGALIGHAGSTKNLSSAGNKLTEYGTKVFDSSKNNISAKAGLGMSSAGDFLKNSVKTANELSDCILKEAGF